MRNRNNEFVSIIYIAGRKMVDFERRELEIGLELGRSSFASVIISAKVLLNLRNTPK